MNNAQKLVEKFHKTFSCPAPLQPTLRPFEGDEPNRQNDILRVKLLREEVTELEEALAEADLVEVADACADILVLAYGTAVTYGLDIEPFYEEVMRSNMSKLPADGVPLLREDGKIMKPPTYTMPNLAPILGEQLQAKEARNV